MGCVLTKEISIEPEIEIKPYLSPKTKIYINNWIITQDGQNM
jgi:hypothetical protein